MRLMPIDIHGTCFFLESRRRIVERWKRKRKPEYCEGIEDLLTVEFFKKLIVSLLTKHCAFLACQPSGHMDLTIRRAPKWVPRSVSMAPGGLKLGGHDPSHLEP